MKKGGLMNQKNLVTFRRPFWCQDGSWDQTPGKLFPTSFALQDAKNTYLRK